MPGFEIIGSGHYVPGKPVTNDDLSRVMDTSDEWIYSRSGIRQRHYCPEGVGSSGLAFEASKRAIEAAGIKPKEIDYIVFATMTPDYLFPGSGGLLGAKLGIQGVPALDIRQQCGAMLFGLQIIEGLLKSGAAKTILFVGAESHAGFMPWEDWDVVMGESDRQVSPEARKRANEHRAVAVLFGDGAGALIFRGTDRDAGLKGMKLYSDGSDVELLYIPGGGYKHRPIWRQEFFEQQLHVPRMNGREVFKFAVTSLSKAARELVKDASLTLNDIDWYLAHQANQRINEYVRDQLGVPPEKMPQNIEKYGNTSAATIPILIDENLRNGNLKRGDLSMLLALGAGFHWGTALYKF